jgi:acyl-coenzyme A synthetase/AMP-(fatty) acid ligase
VNFAASVFRSRHPADPALLAVGRDSKRRSVSFGELEDRSARLAGRLVRLGVQRGDVVMTVMGSTPDWVAGLLAAFRLGAVALPCVTQSRAGDLAQRGRVAAPAVVLTTEEHVGEVERAALGCPTVVLPDATLTDEPPADHVAVADDEPAFLIFTSGTSGEPKAVVHGARYLTGQALQAKHWLDVQPGDLVWCTAAAGWSKSARNSFIAAWLCGAVAVVHDGRFDPQQRVDLVRDLRVTVLCMAPTEYRMVLRRARFEPFPALRSSVAAGEALEASTVEDWRAASGAWLRDGFGQTETGAITANPPGRPPRPGSMGRPLPGIATEVRDGQLYLDPSTSPTFFLGYRGLESPAGRWATGDLVDVDDDGFLWFRGRADDVIVSAGYRIGPTEVEAALGAHPAVHEAGVVAHPDPERGQVVRAVIVLVDGAQPSEALVRDLQDHVKTRTAPYKYPRVVDFVDELPRTASGKLQRSRLRA